MDTKICRGCNAEKSLSEFHINNKSKDGHQWKCKKCCNETSLKWSKTESGRSKHKETEQRRRQNHPESIILSAAKINAKRKNIDFSLSLEDIIIPKYCPVLGIPLNKNQISSGYNSPSIDRIDNIKGYTPDNIVIVSDRVNRVKRDSSLEELKQILMYMKGEI